MRWHNLNNVLVKRNHVPYELAAANVYGSINAL
jgi:hypothetical protein